MSGALLPTIGTLTDLINFSLFSIGNRQPVKNLSTDQSAQAITARTMTVPLMQTLMRAANWGFLRADAPLTLWKAAVINGTASTNPPPTPFLYSYLYPPDCLRGRFLLPTQTLLAPGTPPLTTNQSVAAQYPPAPTGIPFVPGTDVDANGNPIRVILTNLLSANLVYTRDLSQNPSLWDPLFLTAASAFLGSYLIQANMRNSGEYAQQVGNVKGLLDQARSIDGDEGGPISVDTRPDWIAARQTTGAGWGGWNQAGAPGTYGALGGYESVTFPCGLRY